MSICNEILKSIWARRRVHEFFPIPLVVVIKAATIGAKLWIAVCALYAVYGMADINPNGQLARHMVGCGLRLAICLLAGLSCTSSLVPLWLQSLQSRARWPALIYGELANIASGSCTDRSAPYPPSLASTNICEVRNCLAIAVSKVIVPASCRQPFNCSRRRELGG